MGTMKNNTLFSIEYLTEHFTELPATHPISECRAIMVNEANRTFWLTTISTGEFAKKLQSAKLD